MRFFLLFCFLFLEVSVVHAAGLFLAPRGVRALSRGGAFVAGADDVNALSYNPAGLAESNNELLLDMALPVYQTTYQTNAAMNAGTAHGNSIALPSPTLGARIQLPFVSRLSLGASLTADYPALQNWEPSGGGTNPSAQRYAIGNYNGTLISKLALGAGYRLTDMISLGAAFQLMTGTFGSETTLSSCDGILCTQPENPNFDSRVQILSKTIMSPGAHVGVMIKPTSWLRFGLAWESGYNINTAANLRVRLPSDPSFDQATLSTNRPTGRVRMRLPQTLRVGAELRYQDLAKFETAFVWEQWSVHQNISIQLNNVQIQNMVALGNYDLKSMTIHRGFRDTWSIRAGGEITPRGILQKRMTFRAGVMYEPSAIPTQHLTAMTVDLDKILASAGLAYRVRSFVFELTYAHLFLNAKTVRNSSIFQNNPTRPAFSDATAIGNGSYQGQANLFGAGVKMLF